MTLVRNTDDNSLLTWLARIQPDLNELVTAACLRSWPSANQTDPDTQTFFEEALKACQGGKRLRAFLAIVGFTLIKPNLASSALPHVAAALELYQASALVHDDIIDHANTRRGRPATHQVFAERHRLSSAVGDHADFGVAAAIQVGDQLLSASFAELSAALPHLSSTIAAALIQHVANMQVGVAWGQYRDVLAESAPLDPADQDALSVEKALTVVQLKAADYSVVAPTLAGMLVAGSSPILMKQVKQALQPWGKAFQLRDDVLGIFGDPARTGKPVGADLLEGKRTALLALTWRFATFAERGALTQVLGNSQADAQDISRACDIIDHRGRSTHEALIAQLVDQGREAAAHTDLDDKGKDLLNEVATLVTQRDR